MQLLHILGIFSIAVLISVTIFFFVDLSILFSETSTAYQNITKGYDAEKNLSDVVSFMEYLKLDSTKVLTTTLTSTERAIQLDQA